MVLDRLQRLGGVAEGFVHDHLGSELAAEHGALHRAQELLRRPISREHEVGDRRLLRRAVLVPSWDGGVDGARCLDHSILPQPGLALGRLRGGGWPAVVVGDLGGEEARELPHRRVDDLLVRLGDPVRVAARKGGARREDELEHRLLGVVVLLARGGHVCVHREERRAGEAEVVHRVELPVKPHVQVDHGDALELVELAEVRHLPPRARHVALEDVDRHRRDVDVGRDRRAVAHAQARDGAVLVRHDLLHGRVGEDLAPAGLDVGLHGSADAVGLVAVEEGHLQAVVLVEKPVHRGEHDGHRELVRVDKVERFSHRDEDLVVDPLGHAVLAHKLEDRELILPVDEVLPLQEHRQQSGDHLQLLLDREHLRVAQDRQRHVERRGDAVSKLEGGELTGQILHGKGHAMRLPLQTVLDIELGE
mmetsp:Transcript_30765/g.52633  ORF Transcript_30765/g.52633 Transcript_30765/m.52633 type:complete len:420 (+) Transcript_30765:455-1714(+)